MQENPANTAQKWSVKTASQKTCELSIVRAFPHDVKLVLRAAAGLILQSVCQLQQIPI